MSAACSCPVIDGAIRHRRETCTDPVVARLDWYADRGVTGPLETEAQARELPAVRAVYGAFDADPGVGKMAPHNYLMLVNACEAAHVDLGSPSSYDRQILAWLAGWEPQTCAVVAGIITRAAATWRDGYEAGVGQAEERIRELEQCCSALERQVPQARQLEYEADLAAADLAASGYDRDPPVGADRHGAGCQCPYCYDEDDDPGREVDNEPTAEHVEITGGQQ